MEKTDEVFLTRMKKLLKNDYDEYLKNLNMPPYQGLRINTLLTSKNKIVDEFKKNLSPLSFYENGFYLKNLKTSIGNHPYHHSGAFYIQEPSQMAAALALHPKPNEKVLDLCACPGGKATQMAAMMENKGVLVVNEYIKKRVTPLISNIERLGVRNSIVISMDATEISKKFNNYFDKILIDAPCSGEGMFRKNKNAIKEWSERNSNNCAKRQIELLKTISKSLRKGGEIVYSTCTFSKEENEDIIERFLKEEKNFELLDIKINFGVKSSIDNKAYGVRVFPQNGGEGSFVAKLVKKEGEATENKKRYKNKSIKQFNDFVSETMDEKIENTIKINNNVYIIPSQAPIIEGAIRIGVLAGTIKNDIFKLSHHLYKCNFKFKEEKTINLKSYEKDVEQFLHGDVLKTDKTGYISVKVDDIPLGFGKANGRILKNLYPKGLRKF